MSGGACTRSATCAGRRGSPTSSASPATVQPIRKENTQNDHRPDTGTGRDAGRDAHGRGGGSHHLTRTPDEQSSSVLELRELGLEIPLQS
jgi:hypothetical protein